ncbi:hypothetical protein CLG96_07520 [Sphingomonas oleivorans]|uniref:Xcc1710-like domain-containing protein n=1 Tax=Sphingomonas oleivorans TaxID=1735121 RepID=A0A2T5G098_9SPHN|nr:MTH938/NDUFAF3 family protein [Sphingomonas oleivorans]PTQ12370.1 hypothetical protein CLG96_07520 [Sphingomonas oleivorans]
MAKLDRDTAPAGPVVQGFVGGGFRIGDRIHADGLLLAPDWARGWKAPALDALTAEHVADLLAQLPPPEFLLLGTGATLRRPSAGFVAALEGQGIGVEPMDSRAAARAWGMLRGEGRWIVGALLPYRG